MKIALFLLLATLTACNSVATTCSAANKCISNTDRIEADLDDEDVAALVADGWTTEVHQ